MRLRFPDGIAFRTVGVVVVEPKHSFSACTAISSASVTSKLTLLWLLILAWLLVLASGASLALAVPAPAPAPVGLREELTFGWLCCILCSGCNGCERGVGWCWLWLPLPWTFGNVLLLVATAAVHARALLLAPPATCWCE